ncbi:peroxiredoxin [Flavobacteriaceae bacterium]|nr:peroxiredoxin [Flavobacteriaceae bacterium]
MSLKVGDRIPHFELLNQHAELFNSKTVLGVKPLVVYFYPKDETPGCTAEACSFRDHYEEFLDLGAEVIGISSDGVKSHQKFAARHKLPFVLLSDSKKKVQHLFKLPKILFGMYTKRITFVIDKTGLVSYVHSSLMPDTHIKKALQQLK